jgi:Tol biopolymer transport system component
MVRSEDKTRKIAGINEMRRDVAMKQAVDIFASPKLLRWIWRALLAFVAHVLAASAFAGTVSVVAGNVVYEGADNMARALTSGGADAQASLSPDGSQVVFVRANRAGANAASSSEGLWMIDVRGGHLQHLLVNRPSEQPEANLSQLNNPVFSADGKSIYFMSVAWATSNAVHMLDLTTGKTRFVTAGNSVDVIPRGKHVGMLVVQKHQYRRPSGSEDVYWLVSPQGQQRRRIGTSDEVAQRWLRGEQ